VTDRASRPDGTRSIEAIQDEFRGRDYITDRSLATAVFLALELGRPLLLEGEAGVGKTELAKVLAASLGARLIRLQCYEGLDESKALYEWEYAKQLLYTQLLKDKIGETIAGARTMAEAVDRIGSSESVFFSERFLLPRPILQAILADEPTVLLVDEIDKADPEFEAFLLEVLADNQVTVPEVGTIRAEHPPIVVVTTNRTREIHDALKRRCFYHWVDYPDAARELEIVTTRVPGIRERLAAEVVGFVQRLRAEDLFKRPGVAETIDWASALTELDQIALDPATVNDTLGVLLKYQDDIARVGQSRTKAMLDEVRAELAAAE
jgi:MoxR-like ATPase